MLAFIGVPVPSLQIGRLTRNLRAPLSWRTAISGLVTWGLQGFSAESKFKA